MNERREKAAAEPPLVRQVERDAVFERLCRTPAAHRT